MDKKITIWYAVDANGKGYAFSRKPERHASVWCGPVLCFFGELAAVTPECAGVTWQSEPVQLEVSISLAAQKERAAPINLAYVLQIRPDYKSELARLQAAALYLADNLTPESVADIIQTAEREPNSNCLPRCWTL